MKTIQNPTFTLIGDGQKPHSAVSLLMLCLSTPPQGGFDLSTMRARNRVADAIEKLKDGDAIALEDQDHATAVGCIREMKWNGSHRDLIKFAELFGL